MSWPMVKLGDVVSFIGGSQPPKSTFLYEPKKGFVRLLQIRDYKSDKNLTFIPETSTKKFCTKDDVMIGRYGPPVFQILQGLEGAYNVALMKAKPSEKVDRDYLYYFLKQDELFRLIDGLSQRTAGQSGIDMDALKGYPMLLPPLAEQKRIAAILDKADAIRRKRQEAIQLADNFLRSVFLDMFGDPVSNPKDFEKVCLGHVCKIKGGKRIPKGEKLVKENTGYPYIKAGNIKNGRVNTNKLEYVPHHVREKIARYTVEAGDVCLTVVGANIGDVGVVPNELNNASLTENANKLLIQNKNIITNFYLASALQMDFIQNQIKSKTMAVGVPKLALFRIEQLEILIPPMELQTRFESIVNKVDGYLDRMATSGSFCDKQFNSLSQKAFAGEL